MQKYPLSFLFFPRFPRLAHFLHTSFTFTFFLLVWGACATTWYIPQAQAASFHEKDFLAPLLIVEPSEKFNPAPLPETSFRLTPATSGVYGQEMLDILQEQIASPLDPAWNDLIEKLVNAGFDRATIMEYFRTLGKESYSPIYMGQKVAEIHGVRSQAKRPKIDRSMLYRAPGALKKMTIGECVRFLETNRHHFRNIETRYGVSRDIVLSVALIETGVGRNLGGESSLRVLGSMAATTSPAMLGRSGNSVQVTSIDKTALNKTLHDKSAWAYKELTALLRYAEQNQINAAQIPSSMYGAVGIGQFMPSNLKKFAVDGDGNGQANVFNSIDAMYSIAKYLHAHGWEAENSAAQNDALYAYNRSAIYVNNVFAVAERIAGGKLGNVALDHNPLTEIPSVHSKNYSNLYTSG